MGDDGDPIATPDGSIGPYRILETVATRAFTVTYRAEQPGLGRTVLIRTLKPTVSARSAFAAELEREAAALARLDHEAIVRLHELDHTPESIRVVIEDARGPTLAEVIAAGRVDPDAAAAVALAIARALGHAHERGVVCRALRPAAVLVTKGGGVKLTDFASAELPGAPPEPVEAGETFARPDYLAPEQILGETAGARSDVWALGVVLHEMLAGARPFEGEDRRAIAQRIRGGPPAPLPSGVPRALETIVGRCLAKTAGDRFEDGRALAAALEDALASRTRLPVPVLISRALAAAKLGDEIAARGPAGAVPVAAHGPDVRRTAARLAGVLALIVAGGAVIQLQRDAEPPTDQGAVAEAGPIAAGSRDRGLVRVVATPWAEVYLDGELVDVTPIGRPIQVTPGKHFVTFRHPRAPDQQRSIKIAAGQTVFLDVTMRVERAADAGARDGSPDAAESP